MVIILALATFVENTSGTAAAKASIYGAPWFVALWGVLGIMSTAVIVQAKLYRRPAAFMLHLSFVLILSGALTTHISGRRGTIHLRMDEGQAAYEDMETKKSQGLPFTLRLSGFKVKTYPGTSSPMDFISNITITGSDGGKADIRVSMNNIGEYNGYRFYQSGYDNDRQGTVLSVSHDPWGIGITYLGYTLLFLSMAVLLVSPKEGLRRFTANRKSALPVALAMMMLLNPESHAAGTAQDNPKTLPKDIAEQFCELYTYYNGRICPLQTAAIDFTTKLYGKPSYRHYTAEQVFTGWLLFPTSWVTQPMIKVKGKAKEIIGTGRGYASYNDFHGIYGYKLESAMAEIHSGGDVSGARDIREADEKMNIILMLFKGELMKIYPYNPVPAAKEATGIEWFSQGDVLPESMPNDKWLFIKKSLDYVGELVWMKKYGKLREVIGKIKEYQKKEAGSVLPSDTRIGAEKIYNRLHFMQPIAVMCIIIGISSFFIYLFHWINGRKIKRWLIYALNSILALCLCIMAVSIILRGYVSGHLPLSNGFETMQFMSFCVFLSTLLLRSRYLLVTPFGFLLGGLTMLVAVIGESSPQITPLMPVLSSPLLSIHVCIIMVAYSLLAFTMLNGLTAIVLKLLKRGYPRHISQLQYISTLLLYPAEFCLAAGIFIGAVWANVSWGTYWSWDPKEVWALITLLIYSLPLHRASLPVLNRPMTFHIYITAAFLTVLMTYFGVNYFLGGMHSYA